MDIEIKRMSSDTIELFDQLNIVCKRFHVDYLHASEKISSLWKQLPCMSINSKKLMSRG